MIRRFIEFALHIWYNEATEQKGCDALRYTVLVAEDERDIVALLSLYLKSNGYDVLTAYNGLDALVLVQTRHVDLALLDIMMPD
mgnify:CR=1 FL=1